jgi:hypothetical protein
VLGQLVHRDDVADVAREAHDVAPASIDPKPSLDRGDGSKRVEDFTRFCGQRAAGSNFGEGAGMDRAVLAHLQLGEVKAERLNLPHEVLQLAERQTRCARGRERVLHTSQVIE